MSTRKENILRALAVFIGLGPVFMMLSILVIVVVVYPQWIRELANSKSPFMPVAILSLFTIYPVIIFTVLTIPAFCTAIPFTGIMVWVQQRTIVMIRSKNFVFLAAIVGAIAGLIQGAICASYSPQSLIALSDSWWYSIGVMSGLLCGLVYSLLTQEKMSNQSLQRTAPR